MMKKTNFYSAIVMAFLLFQNFFVFSQNTFFEEYRPFKTNIPSPEEFLGYPIGDSHTRHDQVVAYLTKLAELSDRATMTEYGKTNEGRKLFILTITSPENHRNLSNIKKKHLQVVDHNTDITDYSDLPIFINLAYNVHGNEPSGTEAALLTAYTLIASNNPKVVDYINNAVIFLDPTINPDGRDRHTNWVNTFKGSPLVADKFDIEHNEGWPQGRTNHYWFDLNRDLLLAVQPESNARLEWFHEWYPNVVTDFHEMGTNSTFFFEPKPPSASLEPVTPDENYTVLTKIFAKQFAADLDSIGSLYFTKERYDATYPGYGSTYGDLQGSLAILFEQASSRGHLQETPTGNLSFPFTIKNQYVTSMATIKAALNNKELLYDYQNRFFKASIEKAKKSSTKGYVFGDYQDKNRTKAFLDLLLKHKVRVFATGNDVETKKGVFKKGTSYIVPSEQPQYLMVQTLFETHKKYRDSVFYDASSWSLVNFYNMKYSPLSKLPMLEQRITKENNRIKLAPLKQSSYGYLIPWDDYYSPAALYQLQKKGVVVKTAQQPFSIIFDGDKKSFSRGTLLIPQNIQEMEPNVLFKTITQICTQTQVQAYPVETGYSTSGIDLGSSNFVTLKKPKAMMLVKGGVSVYEAGEVWHLLEQRMQMPISKVPEDIFYRTDLSKYNTIVLVSGRYNSLNEQNRNKLKSWVAQGNTLITLRTASSWAIRTNLVNENFVDLDEPKDEKTIERLNYGEAREYLGKEYIGGAIFEVDLDITHPLGYGYHNRLLPVYKNNRIWIAPSKNRFSTVAQYTQNPHIDGYIQEHYIEDYMKKSASLLVDGIEKGRVVMFADNPNFRGAWYGTNKLFLNAIFFGSIINVP
ncbi:M14 family zinc carboxypeptidase [Allomuricauda sp. F6463D]|uniref:M14 family zinc carboxypeptidase n=1 Tax=Allomuricauda sp. F6463D TaxID=2926409 RepID=UPI00293E6645|nr:M14 family zinc carboxypeptidase [Muricauda sp. F6463D]